MGVFSSSLNVFCGLGVPLVVFGVLYGSWDRCEQSGYYVAKVRAVSVFLVEHILSGCWSPVCDIHGWDLKAKPG